MPNIALLHYWLTNMRGGENVLAEFCRLYPQADIFTHAWNPARERDRSIHTALQKPLSLTPRRPPRLSEIPP